jgi:hypothetical protein
MSIARFEIYASAATLEDFQAAIDEGLKGSWGAHVMQWTWIEGTCFASAPGAHGSIRLEEGRVVAMIRLSLFALPLRERIHHDIVTVLKRLGEGHVVRF